MAHFKSTVTNIGAEKLAAIVAGGGKLSLTRAAVGSGRTDSDRAAMTALVKEENAEIQTGDMTVTTTADGMTVMRLPVQVTNKGQTAPLPIREVGLYSQDAEGEYLFAVSWLDGEDTDNIIPHRLTLRKLTPCMSTMRVSSSPTRRPRSLRSRWDWAVWRRRSSWKQKPRPVSKPMKSCSRPSRMPGAAW